MINNLDIEKGSLNDKLNEATNTIDTQQQEINKLKKENAGLNKTIVNLKIKNRFINKTIKGF